MHHIARRPQLPACLSSTTRARYQSSSSHNATAPIRSSKLTLEFKNLTIPSAQEVKQSKSSNDFYQPDLSYLAAAPKSFSGQLALQRATQTHQPMPAQAVSSPGDAFQTLEDRILPKTSGHSAAEVSAVRRRAERLARDEERELRNKVRDEQPQSQRRGRMTRGVQAAGRSRQPPVSVGGSIPTRRGSLDPAIDGSDEDYSVEAASIQRPDQISLDLLDLFGGSSKSQANASISPGPIGFVSRKPSDSIHRTILDGDYSMYAPTDGQDYTKTPQHLGAVRYADLTLAHRRGIPINQRQRARKIIQSSVGEGTHQVARVQ